MEVDPDTLMLHLVTYRDVPPEVRADLLVVLGEVKQGREIVEELKDQILASAARVTELEALIRATPHGRHCLSKRGEEYRCTCWKAPARLQPPIRIVVRGLEK